MRWKGTVATICGALAVMAALAPTSSATARPAQDTVSWGAQAPIPGVGGSSDAPAITSCDNNSSYAGTYLMWKGAGSDQHLYFNKMDRQGNWGNQVPLPFGGSSTAPSITCGYDQLIAVWKGVGSDSRIFYSFSDNGGATWTAQAPAGETARTDITPTVDWLPGAGIRPYLVWKGVGSDNRVYSSEWFGYWTSGAAVPGAVTDTPPRATYHLGGFGVVWKGYGSDPKFWFQRLGEDGWLSAPVVIVADGGSSTTPALTWGPHGQQFMTWKGVGSDQRVYYTTAVEHCGDATHPECWNPQQVNPAVGGTSSAPGVAAQQIIRPDGSAYSAEVLVWKGASGDQRLFYSIGALP
ncbi:MAG TPA: hypothetical protein VGP26_05855 [Actinophytocola sp.]|jgi:hypothetical protein|nr:hypothetical protein [Actinophytocola sp.]